MNAPARSLSASSNPAVGAPSSTTNVAQEATAFHDGYERILREFGTDYESVRSKYPHQQKLTEFFASQNVVTAPMQRASIPNAQEFDFKGLLGRILSSSYMPQPGHPNYPAMLRAVEQLFSQCQKDGQVRLEYDCVVTYGKLA